MNMKAIYAEAAIKNKGRRLRFLRNVETGRVKCMGCRKVSLIPLLETRGRVTKSAYCPCCEIVISYDGKNTNLNTLARGALRKDYRVFEKSKHRTYKQLWFKMKGMKWS